MGKEGERIFEIGGKLIKESEIPLVFNLSHLLEDFKKAVDALGKEKAIEKFKILLKKQLKTFIQEQVVLPLSPRFIYSVQAKDDGGIMVLDEDYPAQPDIVKRAEEGYLFAAGKGKHGEVEASRYAEVFVQRYLLEFLQTQKLVDEHLAKDPILSLPILNSLRQSTQPISFTDKQGHTHKAFASSWYAFAMPSSQAHKGGGSYFNVYRLVVIPQKHSDEVRYVVESQGYYHQLGWKTQVKKLLNIDQQDKFDIEKFDEEAIMMRIIRLSEDKNQLNPDQLLVKLGIQAGDLLLPLRIFLAQRRQRQQEKSIEASVNAILEVFEKEKILLKGKTQEERLQIFFEAIGNPLLLNKNVPGSEIVKQYKQILLTTGSRENYLLSLAGVIPSIFTKVGGFSACGLLSAGGGLFKAGTNGANGFGGLPGIGKDSCVVCPSCNHLSTNLNTCSNCHYKRGMPLAGKGNRSSNVISNRLHQPKKPPIAEPSFSLLPSFQLSPKGRLASVNDLFSLNVRSAA